MSFEFLDAFTQIEAVQEQSSYKFEPVNQKKFDVCTQIGPDETIVNGYKNSSDKKQKFVEFEHEDKYDEEQCRVFIFILNWNFYLWKF